MITRPGYIGTEIAYPQGGYETGPHASLRRPGSRANLDGCDQAAPYAINCSTTTQFLRNGMTVQPVLSCIFASHFRRVVMTTIKFTVEPFGNRKLMRW